MKLEEMKDGSQNMKMRSFYFYFVSIWLLGVVEATIKTSSVLSPYSIEYVNAHDELNSDKLLVQGTTAYVGGRNFIIILNFHNQSTTVKRENFTASHSDMYNCEQYSQGIACENAVRVLEVLDDGTLFICGTSAGHPKCYFTSSKNFTLKHGHLDAQKWISSNPQGSTTSLLIGHNRTDAELYVGSVVLSQGKFSKRIPSKLKSGENWLNAPEFKGSYVLGYEKEKIYTIFNEKSTNFVGGKFDAQNHVSDYYSMVARVCRKDEGGSWNKNMWMTFTKARMVCAWPGDHLDTESNLYYNELVGTDATEDSVFGIFRTNRKWNVDSFALCMYDAENIDAVFEGVYFQNNRTRFFDPKSPPSLATTFVPHNWKPPFLPGQCPASVGYSLKSQFEQFAKKYTLVKMNVLPVNGKPFYIENSNKQFKFILVQSISASTVIFLVSESGLMKKMILFPNLKTEVLFEKQLSLGGDKITQTKLMVKQNKIIAITETKVLSIPTAFCDIYTDCESCSADPYCQWTSNSSSLTFSCTPSSDLTAARTCSKSPPQPTNISTKLTSNDLVVTWQANSADSKLYFIVQVKEKHADYPLVMTRRNPTTITIPKSKMRGGCVFEIAVKAVNGTSTSNETKMEYSTSMERPTVNYQTKEDDCVTISWTVVSGATQYNIKLFASKGNLMQEIIMLSKATNLYCQFSNLSKITLYTVTVIATSKYGITSQESIEVQINPVNASTTLAFATLSNCQSILFPLVLFATLFTAAFCVFLYNIFMITPNVTVLRNDTDGVTYRRYCLLFWSREESGKSKQGRGVNGAPSSV